MSKPIPKPKRLIRNKDVVEEDSVLRQIQEDIRRLAEKEAMDKNVKVNKKTLKETLFGG